MLKKLALILSIFIIVTSAVACDSDTDKDAGAIIEGVKDKTDASVDLTKEDTENTEDMKETNETSGDYTEDTGYTDFTYDTENTEEQTEDETGGTTEPTESTEAIINPQNDTHLPKSDVFEIYDNPDLGFKIQYPTDWAYIDRGMTAEEFDEMVREVYGPEAADLFARLGADSSAVAVMWYDFKNATETFIPNANITVSDSGGITQNDLKVPSNLIAIQNSFESYYPQIIGGFEPGSMTGQAMGDNYFASYEFNYSMDSAPLSCYQASTEKNGALYTFTFMAQKGKLDFGDYEKMLSSLEFY